MQKSSGTADFSRSHFKAKSELTVEVTGVVCYCWEAVKLEGHYANTKQPLLMRVQVLKSWHLSFGQ